MSGGRYDYMYSRIDSLAEEIEIEGDCSAAPPGVRAAFVELLQRVARAARAIEWNDSMDGDSEEEALIRRCLPLDLLPAKEPES